MEDRPIRKILLPTDFSETADEALRTAVAMARVFGAAIELVHVSAPIMVLPPPIELVSLPTLMPDLPRRLEEGLAARAERVRAAGIACETRVVEGHPAAEIVRRAQEGRADLVVMGTHGRTGLRHAVLGSVAERVVQRTPCPVLVVPVRQRPSG